MDTVTIGVQVVCPDADAEDLHEVALNLRDAVLSADVDDVQLGTAGAASAGAKSGEVLTVGALVVLVAPTVVESLMAVVSSWLMRQPGDVEVEIGGHRFQGEVTRSQRDQLVAAYLRQLDREP